MHPDAPRHEVVATLRSLSALVQRALPRRVKADQVLLTWEAAAPLILSRIARQGESLALLAEHGHELDGEMVMRSMLEHTTLFAWLAIEPRDTTRQWRALDPIQNTQWWMVSQFQREKKLTQDQDRSLGGVLNPATRTALRLMTKNVNRLPARGEFPSVLQQAEEIDAHWSKVLAGWQDAELGDPGFPLTFRGHYWTLYTRGSTSVHPDYGAIRRFLRAPAPSAYQRHYLSGEQTGDEVNLFIGIGAFLMADALAVADAVLGWRTYDDALHILGRWNEVRAPGLLLAGAQILLGNRRRRRYGRVNGLQLRIEITKDQFCMVVVERDGSWTQMRHPIGTRLWHLDQPDGQSKELAHASGFELGPAVLRRIDLLTDTRWLTARPRSWPADLP